MAKLLIVDDDNIWLQVLNEILETAGHTLTLVGSFESAIVKLRNDSYDVIILDLFLSATQSSDDPFIWLNALVSGLKSRQISVPPIIVVTGYPIQQSKLLEAFSNYRKILFGLYEKHNIDYSGFIKTIDQALGFNETNGTRSAQSQATIQRISELEQELNKIKLQINTITLKETKRLVWLYAGFLGIIWISLAGLTIKFGWNDLEPWTYFLGLGISFGSYAVFAITLREASPFTIFELIRERKKKSYYKRLGLKED